MKLAYIELRGFRGYRDFFRIDFSDGFTVIDGRNGTGKSTIFDAVEYALTGTIGKYLDAKADGETVADYIWWSGEGATTNERYVEVGFRKGADVLPIRRTQFAGVDEQALKAVQEGLIDSRIAPRSPLPQLCRASIIRDEHIAALSLDLKETERYSHLREAIGATDADKWIERGSNLLGITKKRIQAIQREVEEAAKDVETAARRIDEIRAAALEGEAIAKAVSRLQSFAKSAAPPDQLIEPARIAISEALLKLEQASSLEAAWREAEKARAQLNDCREAVSKARAVKALADHEHALALTRVDQPETSSSFTQRAHDFSTFVALGRKLGRREGLCPLCASNITVAEFERGLEIAQNYAKQLDTKAFEQAEIEESRRISLLKVEASQAELGRHEKTFSSLQKIISDFEYYLVAAGLTPEANLSELLERQQLIRSGLNTAREDLRIVETLKLGNGLERAIYQEAEAKEVYARTQEKLGLARRAEGRAQALYDAARRAVGETLNRRLERVLPLMAELYRRLRPHPVWGDIEYKIRGDVKRFLTLQVGNDLNPQFIFSSGQRRATGLAFLLSVNLSLAWSHWNTILLDDPVQHIDDFRSIQLAEVMAQLSTAGRQIICAVEDAALADLLCRRLPIEGVREGKRVTLGPDAEGALVKLTEQDLAPLVQGALVLEAPLRET